MGNNSTDCNGYDPNLIKVSLVSTYSAAMVLMSIMAEVKTYKGDRDEWVIKAELLLYDRSYVKSWLLLVTD
jgi:hypothetical protein